jgi:transcriptional regulator with XRE-family HTH domain
MAKEPARYATIGQELKRLRKEKGFTLEELAERAEISTSYLSHIERGTRQASLTTLETLAKILGAGLYELLPLLRRSRPAKSRPLTTLKSRAYSSTSLKRKRKACTGS